MSKLRVLDLFSGIGGFSLGLERTGGFETVAFCEIDPFCRRVLAKHWPEVPIHADITALDGRSVAADVVCGGFPCQDISLAGAGAGLDGDRSGLWREMRRVIGEVRPRFCAVGAPHRRDRIWIIASDASCGRHGSEIKAFCAGRDTAEFGGKYASDADSARLEGRDGEILRERAGERTAQARRAPIADADGEGEHDVSIHAEMEGAPESSNPHRIAPFGPAIARQQRRDWLSQSTFRGMDDGLSAGLDGGLIDVPAPVEVGVKNRVGRLRSLGNSVVPQIPEMIGRAILQTEAAACSAP